MTTTPIDDDAELTLPEVAQATGLSVDRLRRDSRRLPELARLMVWRGPFRTVRVRDLNRVKQLVAAGYSTRPGICRKPLPAGQ
jgi:hypothetical protein